MAISLFGVAVLAGFALHIAALVQLSPGRDAAMSAQSGASLVLAGLMLVWLTVGTRSAARITAALGLLLLALNLAVLAENLLDKDFGLDQPHFYAWLTDAALRPGRMAPNTAFAFALFALAVLLLPRIQTQRGALLLRGLTVAVIVVAAAGLAGYFVHIEALYTYHGMAAMAPYSAGALLVLALGLWLAWRPKRWNRPAGGAARGLRLISVAAVAVIAVVTVAAVVNFALLWHLQQRDAETDLSLRRDERANHVRELIESARARGRLFAMQQSERWSGAGPTGLLPPQGEFSATELLDPAGRVLARSGNPALDPTLALPLSPRASLLWSQGPVLRQRLPVARNGKLLGTVIVEQEVPLLASVGIETSSWGQTGEMGLCGRPYADSALIECFPMRRRPYPFAVSPTVNGLERPITRALEGRTGVVQAPDYRGERTLAAFAPIPGMNLGLVLKMDTTEIYASVRRQIELMVPLLLALTLVALEILRWQMRPLVRELVESRNQAIQNEARFRAAAESSQDAFYIFECEREPMHGGIRDFRVVYVNQPGEALAACQPNQPPFTHLSECPRLAKIEHLQDTLRQVVATRQAVNEEFALPDTRGVPQWLHHQAVPLGDGVAVTLRNISERKWEQERLISLTETDSLTGLANRSAFRKRLQHAMETSRRLRQQALLALLYLDIDYFKQINDSLGHAQGDRLLQAFATRLRGCVRSLDSVARLGGDEFTILLENLDGAADAERVVAAIYAALRQPIRLDGQVALVTASIGVAFYRGEEIAPDELLRRADTALYQAKRSGRNVFRVFAA
ncbi:MAG TPA: GGDEF domain-containing protein [Terriglobales bacterium]|nr:GGDEF domain-containing protein [Terriglobales bacterium]